MSEKRTVYLKRLAKSSWSGILKFDGATDKLTPFMSDNKRGKITTGLTNEDAQRLEKALALKEGELSPYSDYWDEFFVMIENDRLELDLDDPEDELYYLFLKAHPLVADGFENTKKRPSIKYVLYSEVDQAKASNLARETKQKAYVLFDKMTRDEKIDALILLGEKPTTLSPEMITDRLGFIVESNPKKFVAVLGDKFYNTKLFLLKALNAGIITKGRGDYDKAIFTFGDEYLGEGLDKAVEFVLRDRNQGVKIAIQQELKRSSTDLLDSKELKDIEAEFETKEEGETNRDGITPKRGRPKAKKEVKQVKTTKGQVIKSKVEEVTGDGLTSPEFDELPQ